MTLERGAASRVLRGATVLDHPERFTQETFDDLSVVFGMLPWWQPPDLATFALSPLGLCFIPFQGWKDGVWHDGPLVRLNGAGEVVALAPVGGAVRLETPLAGARGVSLERCLPWLHDEDGESAKISMAIALRQRFGELASATVCLRDYDTCEALLCVLLRVAFPGATLIVTDAVVPPWRRLLQNLGVLHGRAPRPRAPAPPLDLAACRDLIPASREPALLRAIQRPSGVIPSALYPKEQTSSKLSRAEGCATVD